MDITITHHDGWALLTFEDTDRTAICIPRHVAGPPESLNFEVVGWHESRKDALDIVVAMKAMDFTRKDYEEAYPAGAPAQDPEPPLIESEPEQEPPRGRSSVLTTLRLWLHV